MANSTSSTSQSNRLSEKKQLRHQARTLRQSLSPTAQKQASLKLAKQVACLPQFIRAKCITCYLADDGEIDLTPTIMRAWRMNKRVLLPKLPASGDKKMLFASFSASDRLANGQFDLPEPQNTAVINPRRIDLMLVPLVAFDRAGHRLGRGGGYYDRFLHKLRSSSTFSAKPFLLGVAHTCQETKHIPTESWDIPLDAIATDKEIIWPKSA